MTCWTELFAKCVPGEIRSCHRVAFRRALRFMFASLRLVEQARRFNRLGVDIQVELECSRLESVNSKLQGLDQWCKQVSRMNAEGDNEREGPDSISIVSRKSTSERLEDGFFEPLYEGLTLTDVRGQCMSPGSKGQSLPLIFCQASSKEGPQPPYVALQLTTLRNIPHQVIDRVPSLTNISPWHPWLQMLPNQRATLLAKRLAELPQRLPHRTGPCRKVRREILSFMYAACSQPSFCPRFLTGLVRYRSSLASCLVHSA